MSTDVAIGTPPQATTARRGSAFAGAWLVSGAMVASGLLTYGFFVLAARRLGAEAFGQIALLWGVMFVAAVMLFRPLEQTISRETADRIARGEDAREVTRVVLGFSATVVVGIVVVGIAAWGPITAGLFGGDATLTALLITGTVMYGLSYLVRGMVGGVRWFGGYSLGLVVDAAARLVIALPLVWTASKGVAAAAIVSAGAASALIPLLIGRRRLGEALRTGLEGERFHLGSALAFAAPASLIAAADQLLINGGALLVAIDGGPDATAAAGTVFAATILVRAPVYVFTGVAASLLPNLTHLRAAEERTRFRAAMFRATAVLTGAAALIVAGTWALGPLAMDVLYGAGFEAGRRELTLLAVGVSVYLLSSTYSQALLALGRARRAALAWAASAAVFVGSFFSQTGTPLERVAFAFVAASLVGLAVLVWGLTSVLRRDRR